MTRKSKLQRLPISERVSGFVTRVGADVLLSATALAGGEVIASGELFVRYGITYLGKPQLSIVPDLVVADYGELLIGEAAWTFLMERGHLYPRADVCGFRNDGQDDMLVLKQLEFDHPYDVFVYRQVEGQQPLAKLSALITPETSAYPERLRKHLPSYASVSEWQQDE